MRSRTSLLALLLAAFVSCSHAQELRGPDSWSRTFVPGIDVLPIPNLPFSGLSKTIWTRPVEGGGAITSYLRAKAIRDSQGRIYRERHHFSSNANADPQTTIYEFYIDDPVSHSATTCTIATHACHITGYRPRLNVALQSAGPFDQGRRYLTRESLGNQYIEGNLVLGTLEKIAISPGTIGNDQLITLSREFWYSSDLKTNLTVTRKDPRQGTQAIALTILSRNEPDASVFAVPSGYTVIDDRAPRPSN